MWRCPVCNGLRSIQLMCPRCSDPLDDLGKVSDFYGDYSPYREIDDLKKTNGFPDLRKHQCMHYSSCPNCGFRQTVAVNEDHLEYNTE